MIKRILKAVFVIIGTVIGAGFASGKEIYMFFFQYGAKGILGMILSSTIIGFIIYKVIDICRINQIDTYKDFLNIFINNEKQLNFFNTIINLFILITFYIMISGFGAYFEQQFKIYSLIGSGLLAIICYFVFLKDVSGLIKVNLWIVPILISSLLVIGVHIIETENILQISSNILTNLKGGWLLDSILYGSYNTILLIPVLITLRKLMMNRKEEMVLSIITSIIVTILSLVVFFMLIKVDINIENLEMPAVYVASKILPIFKYAYGFIILSSILTTSISLGTSFLENVVKHKKSKKIYAMFICVSSVLISNIGFSNLVSLLYPVFGYIGLVQIIRTILPMKNNRYFVNPVKK